MGTVTWVFIAATVPCLLAQMSVEDHGVHGPV